MTPDISKELLESVINGLHRRVATLTAAEKCKLQSLRANVELLEEVEHLDRRKLLTDCRALIARLQLACDDLHQRSRRNDLLRTGDFLGAVGLFQARGTNLSSS